MTGPDVALIITAVGTLITSLGSVVISIRNGKGIDIIHKQTNSMKDELVAEVRKASFAEGEKEQKENPK